MFRAAFTFLFCLISGLALSQAVREPLREQGGRTTAQLTTKLNINNISAWFTSNGEENGPCSTSECLAGLTYPRGTVDAAFFGGIVWTGRHHDNRVPSLRTDGIWTVSALQPGIILGIRTGIPEDPSSSGARAFRIRKDYATANLRQDAAEINNVGLAAVNELQIRAVRDQYERDWREWPAQKGAPFYDADSDGVYTPRFSNGRPALYPNADEPGIAGADQVVWFACNDIGGYRWWTDVVTGIELQVTVWGYARSDALGNVIFKRHRMVYKGLATTPEDATITDMYMGQTSGIELGYFDDNFAGCDTILNLGFAYNATPSDPLYNDFNLPPPAVGYDVVQGPLVRGVAGGDVNRNGIDDASDYAVFNFKRFGPGFINLPMTGFVYARNDSFGQWPELGHVGTEAVIEWNQALRGLPASPIGPPDPLPLNIPGTQTPTRFWLSGDPVKRTGWLDGIISPPYWRWIVASTGPFTIAVGDTQEIVIAVVGGLGMSNIGSIDIMKYNDRVAQSAFDHFFQIPKPPPAPNVKLSEMTGQILLDWGRDSASVAATENSLEIGGFVFEGYNVYQCADATANLSTAKRIATFDIANGVRTIFNETFDDVSRGVLKLPVQLGIDSGIQRSLRISYDAFRDKALANGQEYYFAVTAYSFTNDVTNPTRSLESAPQLIVAIPDRPNIAFTRTDIANIKAFPNPYYGINRAETDFQHRFITFNHLAARAVIRIVNLAGILVRTLTKNDASTQFLQWDLQNDQGLPAASGIYIAYIELQDAQGNNLGTKTLKLAVIQSELMLR